MGEGYSLFGVDNQDVIDKANKLLKISDDETKQLVGDFLKEQNKLKREQEGLFRDKISLQEEIDNLLKVNSEIEKERQKWKCEVERLKEVKQNHQSQIQQLKMESKHSYQTKNLKLLPQKSSSYQGSSDKAGDKIISQCLEEQNNLKREVQKLEQEKCTLLDDNEQLRRDNKILAEEKENALSRLSKMAGIQLTKGNTGIADLSDANRPTNLAEKWSTLYTDEWSDAYDVLTANNTTKSEDFAAEKQMCRLVQECYNICKEIAQSQMKDINLHVWDIACCIHQRPDQLVSAVKTTKYKLQEEVDISKKAETMNPKMDGYGDENAIYKCSEELIEILRERRKYDQQLLQYVIQKTVKHFASFDELKYEGKVISFIKRCTELCWTMVIKDPSMALICAQMEGKPIDRNEFTVYTKNGSIVDFVVWPALFLHKGGPILAKGVVQGRNTSGHDASRLTVDKGESTGAKESGCENDAYDGKSNTFIIHQSINSSEKGKGTLKGQGDTSQKEIVEGNLLENGEKNPLASFLNNEPKRDTSIIHEGRSCHLKDQLQGTTDGSTIQKDDNKSIEATKQEQEHFQNSLKETDEKSNEKGVPFRPGDTLNKRIEQ